MSIKTVLDATVVTPTEKGLVAAAGMVGADAAGLLSLAVADLNAAKVKLTTISASMGAGANKTAIDAYIAGALV